MYLLKYYVWFNKWTKEIQLFQKNVSFTWGWSDLECTKRCKKQNRSLSLLYDAHTTACNPIHCEMESTVINLDIA